MYIACFRPTDRRVESESVENFQDIDFKDLEQQQAGSPSRAPKEVYMGQNGDSLVA
jgi:hypothetical protein